MGDILTQDEVDSLLSGLSAGKVETETDPSLEVEGVVLYDFASQERVIRGRMPTYDLINERLARELRGSLATLLHTTVDVSIQSTETLKFSEFIRSLPVPTSLHVFRMDPLRGHALMVFESQLVYNLIHTLFGGKGIGAAKIEGRDFTPIEDLMIRKVVSSCLRDLEKAWHSVERVETVFIRAEMNPQFASVVLPADLIIVSKFEIELEQRVGVITLCIPYAMIEPIRDKLKSGFQSDQMEVDHAWRERMKQIISDSLVDVAIMLGNTEITAERLLHMKTGDVIQLDQNADHHLIGFIEGVPKWTGHPGTNRGCQAFRIHSKLNME